jgi:hypothetical protein
MSRQKKPHRRDFIGGRKKARIHHPGFLSMGEKGEGVEVNSDALSS